LSSAGPTVWNSLPDNVISAPSLSTFRQRPENISLLHHASFPDIIIDPGKLFSGLPWVSGSPWGSHGYGYGVGTGQKFRPHGSPDYFKSLVDPETILLLGPL